MEPLAVDTLILRTLVGPDINLVEGRAMMARVMATTLGGRGSLSIAGYVLEAELPEDVEAGQDLRLVVRDVTPQRVLLTISDDRPAAPAPTAPSTPMAAPIPLPGGGSVQVTEREADGSTGPGGGGSQALSLRYDAPALGTVDLRLALDPSSLRVSVTVARGEPLADAQAAAGALRDALSEAVARSVTVTVDGRHQPVDLYA